MKSLENWLEDYSLDHQNPRNRMIHKFCVPLIFLSILGALHLIPFNFQHLPIGDLMVLVAMNSYARWGVKPFLIMIAQWLTALAVVVGIRIFAQEMTIWVLLAIFALAWIGQFWGHQIEGRRPSFLTDLQYLMVGPLWIWLGKPAPIK